MKRIVFFQIVSVFIVLFFFAAPISAQSSFCGDGQIDAEEQCDPGSVINCDDDGTPNADPGLGCSANCTVERCGNGTTECDEECDDGGIIDYDNECSATCKDQPAECGNGFVDTPTEECDDGNTDDFDGCSATCKDQPSDCGNSFTEAGEQCDDGNRTPCDGCSVDCFLECGNGNVECNEECDDGDLTDGDGCSSTCTVEEIVCGDGFRISPEQCDDGNTIDCDGCSAECKNEQCGNGTVECDEECDEIGLPTDTCTLSCTLREGEVELCGNGDIDPGEACDDGNRTPDDGCSENCELTVVVEFDPDNPRRAIGINNLELYGTLYNVAFKISALANEVYGDYPGTYTFDTESAARDARNAVNEALTGSVATMVGEVGVSEESDNFNIGWKGDIVDFQPGGPTRAVIVKRGSNQGFSGWQPLENKSWRYNDDQKTYAVFTVPQLIECGNNIPESGEECDDGNLTDGDGCSAICTLESGNPILLVDASCADSNLKPTVCFDFLQGAENGEPGGADEITAIGWCLNWNTDDALFDCTDSDSDNVPDSVSFFSDVGFTKIVTCNLENPDCRLRFSILDSISPFSTLPESTLACAQFQVTTDKGDLDVKMALDKVSAADVEATSIPVDTRDDSIAYSDCCPADCNNDGEIDIADATAVILELSDDDGSNVCDTQKDVPYDGVSCCDCNGDRTIDIADSVCVVNGLGAPGDLVCSSPQTATSLIPTTELPEAANAMGQSVLRGATSKISEPLALEQHVDGNSVVASLVFKQGPDDGLPGGADELTAFNICIDFDQDQLVFDAADGNGDGVPDALNLQLPSSHSPIVRVDLTRPTCELQIGTVDLSSPSEPLQDGTLAKIQFRKIGSESEGIWVRPGAIEWQSFADVQGVSVSASVSGQAEPEVDNTTGSGGGSGGGCFIDTAVSGFGALK